MRDATACNTRTGRLADLSACLDEQRVASDSRACAHNRASVSIARSSALSAVGICCDASQHPPALVLTALASAACESPQSKEMLAHSVARQALALAAILAACEIACSALTIHAEMILVTAHAIHSHRVTTRAHADLIDVALDLHASEARQPVLTRALLEHDRLAIVLCDVVTTELCAVEIQSPCFEIRFDSALVV